jgi:hypothetical protein
VEMATHPSDARGNQQIGRVERDVINQSNGCGISSVSQVERARIAPNETVQNRKRSAGATGERVIGQFDGPAQANEGNEGIVEDWRRECR